MPSIEQASVIFGPWSWFEFVNLCKTMTYYDSWSLHRQIMFKLDSFLSRLTELLTRFKTYHHLLPFQITDFQNLLSASMLLTSITPVKKFHKTLIIVTMKICIHHLSQKLKIKTFLQKTVYLLFLCCK